MIRRGEHHARKPRVEVDQHLLQPHEIPRSFGRIHRVVRVRRFLERRVERDGPHHQDQAHDDGGEKFDRAADTARRAARAPSRRGTGRSCGDGSWPVPGWLPVARSAGRWPSPAAAPTRCRRARESRSPRSGCCPAARPLPRSDAQSIARLRMGPLTEGLHQLQIPTVISAPASSRTPTSPAPDPKCRRPSALARNELP